MRDLKRNQRSIWFAVPTNTVPILDEWGNDTLERETIYLPPARLNVNVSPNMGQEAVEVFGAQTEYSRMVSMTGLECPLIEGSRVWIGKAPNITVDNPNYVVARVADSKNGFLIALREVTPNG